MSCCTPDGSCSTTATPATAAVAEGVTTVYAVAGMTCGHCEATLTREIGAVDGVRSVGSTARPAASPSPPTGSPTTRSWPRSSTRPATS